MMNHNTSRSRRTGRCQHFLVYCLYLLIACAIGINYWSALSIKCPPCPSSMITTTSAVSISHKTRPTRMFLGIFSTKGERDRRVLIRNTMLTMDDRVCDLSDYLNRTLDTANCHVVYAFIMASNMTAPTSNVLAKSLDELVIPPSKMERPEQDAVYLNLRDNMNKGKVPTFFKFGFLLDKGLDYIAKCDSDSMMHMTILVDYIQNSLPSGESSVYHPTYGGTLMDYMYCGGPKSNFCQYLKGRIYMSGSFYFLSRHLAQHVTSPLVENNTTRFPYEDFDMGMRVATYDKGPISLSILNTGTFYKHRLKKQQDWMHWWNIGTSPNSTQANKMEAFNNGWGLWKPDGGGLG